MEIGGALPVARRTVPRWCWALLAFGVLGLVGIICWKAVGPLESPRLHRRPSPSLLQGADSPASVDYVQVRYWATTDSDKEVEALATRSVECESMPCERVHIASVTGGMSGLSLISNLASHSTSTIVSITFYDFDTRLVAMAKLYVALIKISETRADFLQRFYARDAKAGRADAAGITPETMMGLFYTSPFSHSVFEDTTKRLESLSFAAAELYHDEMRGALGEAQSKHHVPAAWPCWAADLEGKKEYGEVFASPTIGYSTRLNPLKTSTLWHNRAGFMKTEERYKQVRQVLSNITDINFVALDLNQQNMSAIAPATREHVKNVVMFTSNALFVPKWVPDGNDHKSVSKRLLTAFPGGGTVLQTHPPLGGVSQWVFSEGSVRTVGRVAPGLQ